MPDPWEQYTPLRKRKLQDAHLKLLVDDSGISPFIVEGRGYYSPRKKAIEKLVADGIYHEAVLKAESWLAIPIWRPDGDKHCEVLRLLGYTGKMKYVWPSGYRNALDVHPMMMEYILDTKAFVLFTEGIRKADSLLTASINEDMTCIVVAVNGADGWKGKTSAGSIPLPDLLDIPLAKRRAITISDSDFRTNNNVRRGWSGCVSYLAGKTGQNYSLLVVTPSKGLEKQGADDYLASGGSLQNLLSLAGSPQVVLLDEPITEDSPLEVRSVTDLFDRAGDKIPHLLDPLLPNRSIVVVAGHSGTLKSWHVMGLMLEAAFQQTWLGHPTLGKIEKPFKSLYINKEMPPAMFEYRWKQLLRDPKYQDVPNWRDITTSMVFSPDKLGSFDLRDEKARAKLEDAIEEYGISLVALDSLSMCWGGNENDNTEIGNFYAQLREISERHDVSWMIIHHTNKPGSTRKSDHTMFSVRGAGQIVNQSDSAIVITRHEDRGSERRAVKIAMVKTRTNQEPPPFISALEDVDGLYISLRFISEVSQDAAESYVKRPDAKALQEYVLASMASFPAMKTSGIRTPQLVGLLKASWPEDKGSAPSDSSFKRALEALVDSDSLLRSDRSQRAGDLFQLPELEGFEVGTSTEESSAEVQSGSQSSQTKVRREQDASAIIQEIVMGDDDDA